jgi:hypothetical protein
LLIKQPFFILGINDIEAAKGSAFGAAGTFFVTFLVSVIYLLLESRRLNADILSSASQTSGRRSQQTNRFGIYATVAVSDDIGGNNDNIEFHYA